MFLTSPLPAPLLPLDAEVGRTFQPGLRPPTFLVDLGSTGGAVDLVSTGLLTGCRRAHSTHSGDGGGRWRRVRPIGYGYGEWHGGLSLTQARRRRFAELDLSPSLEGRSSNRLIAPSPRLLELKAAAEGGPASLTVYLSKPLSLNLNAFPHYIIRQLEFHIPLIARLAEGITTLLGSLVVSEFVSVPMPNEFASFSAWLSSSSTFIFSAFAPTPTV
ncbi:hypothetical protein D9758_005300 [Tetrapyrgos nigripes]|uniref:Uncharacterized protein n=1 Tax=Tetrapyrgos nigripes TaxID=182062 RepID=A0A8H5LX26_9AGAR|nr:hypothetical protein D9758_005300 [Tetrapyrgos nigripes]